ncbi:MAG: 4-hydroxy-tetrahydrodipicolinate reductase [Nitrospinota bacterium]
MKRTGSKVIRVALSGAAGRMGRRVGAALAGRPGVRLEWGILRRLPPPREEAAAGLPPKLTQKAAEALREVDVAVDFSRPPAALALARACARLGRPLLVGTTGFGERERKALAACAQKIPLLYAPNLTRGMNAVFEAAERMAARLGAGYDARVLGIHHGKKKETPSGTSSELARRVAAGRGGGGRLRGGASAPSITTILMGGTLGEHKVFFANANEEIEISHRVTRPEVDPEVLAAALRFLLKSPPGFYGLDDVLRG